jgi:hypothetical protein
MTRAILSSVLVFAAIATPSLRAQENPVEIPKSFMCAEGRRPFQALEKLAQKVVPLERAFDSFYTGVSEDAEQAFKSACALVLNNSSGRISQLVYKSCRKSCDERAKTYSVEKSDDFRKQLSQDCSHVCEAASVSDNSYLKGVVDGQKDSPGLFQCRRKLDMVMQEAVKRSGSVSDAKGLAKAVEQIIQSSEVVEVKGVGRAK